MTRWLLLGAAIITEVAATVALTYSQGLTRHLLSAVTVGLYIVSYVCLARCLHADMDISVAYAVWSGVGTAAFAVLGPALFGESLTPLKITAIVLIVGGVTLLHLAGRDTAHQATHEQSTDHRTATPAPIQSSPAPLKGSPS